MLEESLAIDREKFPSKSVIAPTEPEPLSWTVAPGKGVPFSSLTVPLMFFYWEWMKNWNIKKINKIFLIF